MGRFSRQSDYMEWRMADVTVPTGNFVCECCGLWYPIQRPVSRNIEDRMHRSNKIPTRCSRCASHRGYESDVDILLLRADDHTRWYWEWYKNAVEAARAARRQVDEAGVRVDEARDRAVSAYRSRDHSVRLLRKIAELHNPTATGCSCGKRPDCDTAKIVDGGWVQARIRDLERQDAIERERNRRLEYDDYDDIDGGVAS
jgi:hypothetical protein